MCSKASLYFVAIWAATKFSNHESWSVKSDFLMWSRGRLYYSFVDKKKHLTLYVHISIMLEIGKDVQTIHLEIYDVFKRKLTIRGQS